MGAHIAPSLGWLGPFELLAKLATGGMSEVYEARRAGAYGFSRHVALKRILPQLAADPELVAMFVGEAKLTSQLSHPNLVQVFDFGEERGELYMAMELVRGATVARLVRALAQRGEAVPLHLALYIGLSVARGLEHAHEACDEQGRPLRLIHRDVSPGNVLLSHRGAVKLGDFGIARAAILERRTEHGQLKGKIGYMSPEQVLGRELDDRTDQFSAGIVLAEMLIGRPLFGGGRDLDILLRIRDADVTSLVRHGAHLPGQVRALLLRALSRHPEDRFPTTRAFADAIEEVMRGAAFIVRPAQLAAYLERESLCDTKAGGPMIEAPRGRPGPSSVRTESGRPPHGQPGASIPPSIARTDEPLPGRVDATERYRLRLPSGELGKLSLSEVAKRFGTGRILPETPIAPGDEPLRCVREVDELSPWSEASSRRWGARPSDTSPIVRSEFPGWLAETMIARRTGLLIAT